MKLFPKCGSAALTLLLFVGLVPVRAEVTDKGTDDISIQDIAEIGVRPKLIKSVQPEYPLFMSRAGLVGAVKIEFVIDKTGAVVNPFVTESNNPWFERPAIDAILEWKFAPGTVKGSPVKVRALQLIEFNLDSGGKEPELWRVSKGKDHGKLPPEMRWDTPPKPKSTVFPVYPFEQLKGNVSGKAKVTYVIGPDGQVVKARLDQSTSPEFGTAVMAMIEAWRFEPAKRKVASRVTRLWAANMNSGRTVGVMFP